MFNPGETLVHEFIIPFIYDTIEKVIVTYKQNDRLILIKEITSFQPYIPDEEEQHDDPQEMVPISYNAIDELFYNGSITPLPGQTGDRTKFVCEISQEESLMFEDFNRVKVQINVYCLNGSRSTSSEMPLSSGVQHYKAVIDNE